MVDIEKNEIRMHRWVSGLILLCIGMALFAEFTWVIGQPQFVLGNITIPPTNPVSALLTILLSSTFLYQHHYGTIRNKLIVQSSHLFILLILVLFLTFKLELHPFNPEDFLFYRTMHLVYYKHISISGAIALSLISIHFIVENIRPQKWLRELVMVYSLLLGSISLLGHIYGVSRFYLLQSADPLALTSSISLCCFCIAMMIKNREYGITAGLLGIGTGSRSVRRFLPLIVFIPATFGFIIIYLERNLMLSGDTGIAILVLLVVVVFISMLTQYAHKLNDEDKRRRIAEEQLKELNETLEKKIQLRTHELEYTLSLLKEKEEQLSIFVDQSPAAMAMFDNEMRYIVTSKSWLAMYHLEGQVLAGRSHYDIFPEIRPEWREAHLDGLSGKTVSCDLDFYDEPDGKRIYLSWKIKPWYHMNGKTGGIILFTPELTDKVEAEMQFRNLAEKNMVGIFIMKKGYFKYVNPMMTEILGYDQQELMEMDSSRLIHPEYLGVIEDARRKLPGEQTSIRHVIIKGITKTGQIRWLEIFSNESVMNGQHAVIGTVIDITERKRTETQLKQSEANLQSIFDHTSTGFALLTDRLVIVSFNQIFDQGCLKHFGSRPIIGKNYLEILPPNRRIVVEKMYHEVITEKRVSEYELDFIIEGQTYHYNVVLMPVINGKRVSGLCVSVTDITHRKLLELDKEQVNVNLMQRNKELEQFAYIVSHNLRAPVANIIGLSNIIEDAEPGMDQIHELTGELKKAALRLDTVVQDLNLILQVRKGINESRETFEVVEIIDGIEESIKTFIDETQTEIICDIQANELHSIRSYLHSILYNLITNSIKYRQPDQVCLIHISSTIVDGKWQLRFSDNGSGMDLDKMGDQLFGLYKRFHKGSEGKGVGLYLVRNQVEALGGSIQVESRINSGTTFIITLPI